MKSSEKGLSQFYKPDGLAKILLEEAERIEAERRAEAERLAAMELQRRWLYMQAVNRAREELEEYRKLLESSRNLISPRDFKVNEMLIMELQGRLMSDPKGVEEDARGFRRLLEVNVERIKKAEEIRKERERLRQKEAEAMLYLLVYSGRLRKALRDIDETYNRWALKSVVNPGFEKTYVQLIRSLSYNVNSLADIRDTMKEACRRRLREELMKEFRENPYRRYASFL